MICAKCMRKGVEQEFSHSMYPNGDIHFLCKRCGNTFLIKHKDMVLKKPRGNVPSVKRGRR